MKAYEDNKVYTQVTFLATIFIVLYLVSVPNLQMDPARPTLPSAHTGLFCHYFPQHALSPRAPPFDQGHPL